MTSESSPKLSLISSRSVKRGDSKFTLAPPRELYDVKFREQIDWLRFPSWARPSDPEAYTGCSHEG